VVGNYDVIVVGAGNAALCAAIAAAEDGAHVLVLERAPKGKRGGNTWFGDGAMRFAHRGLPDVRKLVQRMTNKKADLIDLPPYPVDQYINDLMELSEDRADEKLANVLARESYPTMRWLKAEGVPFVLLFDTQAYEIQGSFQFWGGVSVKVKGEGVAFIDSLIERAEKLGVEVAYEARAIALQRTPEGLEVEVHRPHDSVRFRAPAVVLACGGFESSMRERTRHLGARWNSAVVRGTEYNHGDGLSMALSMGAVRAGDWASCHAVATDANAPAYGDREKMGDIFKRHSYPLGIVINAHAKRFIDEGADFRNYTSVQYGREVLRQKGGIAYQIFDAQVTDYLREEYSRPEATRVEAETIEDLAGALELDPQTLADTVAAYNESIQAGRFAPAKLDRKSTAELNPPKSNWALPIQKPPFVAYPVQCAITFTFGGIQVSERAEVLAEDGEPIEGLYAAGAMVGGLFYGRYPSGAGLMAGATFGRIAGIDAARYAQD